ncbi:MAG: protein tyrosine phosphatase [Lachnospiraceae bacterium]|nr:protein tyrosine phosphatase [Lachnospiraceae bacterium]
MNILFICSQNKRRSLTAEKLLDGYNGHRVRSAGTEKNSRVKLTPGLIAWADMIFCFEKKHLRRIRENYSEEISGKTVITMNIPDEYEYMDEELQDILTGYAEEYLADE